MQDAVPARMMAHSPFPACNPPPALPQPVTGHKSRRIEFFQHNLLIPMTASGAPVSSLQIAGGLDFYRHAARHVHRPGGENAIAQMPVVTDQM
jgi:hypothetical protein